MARNRRQSESMTFAIGRGCFLLLAGITCVGFSVIKIIVGSEYVSKCPSNDMIPVYIIVSGCLPVLLSALRQPYDSGHEMEKDKWSIKVMLMIAVFGVMVNLAWLVAGTYLVVTIWGGNFCNTSQLTMPDQSSMPKTVTNETLFTHNDSTWINSNSSRYEYRTDDNENKEDKNVNETENLIPNNNKRVVITAAPSFPDETVQTLEDLAKTNEGTTVKPEIDKTGNRSFALIHDDTYDKLKSSDVSSKNGTESLPNITDFTDMDLKKEMDMVKESTVTSNKTSQDKQCITCDMHILRFSLAVIIIDWLFVIFGIVYFCNFVCHRFSSIASKILLINA